MIKYSLIYVEKDACYLMLHRISKQNDINKGKWIGVGGKLENGESVEDCARREMLEETGLRARRLNYRGIVDFVTLDNRANDEEMHLFTCDEFEGELIDCDEGVLKWVPKDKIYELELWEGDRIFLQKLSTDDPFFRLMLVYDKGKLVESRFI